MTQNKIISWYLNNKRDLPWRMTRNPYFIWISEIILQQTRVAQGLPYYETFTSEYPTITDLANASEDEVLRHWQGLGYYSRGRNLHFTAKYIVNELNGKFPTNFNEILKLKGVGNYTAAAIASFAFKERIAAVDGNVIRVISRLFKIDQPVDSPTTLKEINKIANQLIESVEPDLFNQAMMELGALICTPKSPSCNICPVQPECLSFPEKAYERIPFKEKKTKVLERSIHYIVQTKPGHILLRQRNDSDIWKNMYDFPEENYLKNNSFSIGTIVKEYPPIIHLLSHRRLSIHFTLIQSDYTPTEPNLKWYSFEEAEKLPKPKVVVDFISNLIHS